jgi:hypothetical protein
MLTIARPYRVDAAQSRRLDRRSASVPPGAVGSKRLDSITDYVREGLSLRVECGPCRRVTVVAAEELLARCRRGGDHRIGSIVRRLKCADCGASPKDWGPIG